MYENRNIRIYTGAGGYDLFEELVLEGTGYKRVYLGRKLPRFLHNVKSTALISANGRYYKTKKIV